MLLEGELLPKKYRSSSGCRCRGSTSSAGALLRPMPHVKLGKYLRFRFSRGKPTAKLQRSTVPMSSCSKLRRFQKSSLPYGGAERRRVGREIVDFARGALRVRFFGPIGRSQQRPCGGSPLDRDCPPGIGPSSPPT